MKLLDGKATAQEIKNDLAIKVKEIKIKGGKVPHLAAVLVGEDGASLTYVNAKVKSCQEVGFESTLIKLSADISEKELLQMVADLNNNPEIDGFIVQVPLPHHIHEQKIIEAIDPKKDVDGFHPINIGKMVLGLPTMVPATPLGIMMLLDKNGIEISGKNVVVIGRSHTVGTPVSILMSRNTGTNGNGTVTLAHSRTKDLAQVVKQADIVVVAIGKPEFVTKDMVKNGAVIVDVGIHRIEDATKKSGFSLKGDVKFDEVSELCSFISPVPGGVGPMTIAALMHNTYLATLK